jgi:hypothetical protein
MVVLEDLFAVLGNRNRRSWRAGNTADLGDERGNGWPLLNELLLVEGHMDMRPRLIRTV